MISKNYIYSISLWLYASSIPLYSQELSISHQTALTDYDVIADFDFDDDDFLPYCLNNSNQDNHYPQHQLHNADNNPSALSLMPVIIATQDHPQNINLEASSISHHDDFEESLPNNKISDHQGNNSHFKLSPEEIQQCKDEQIKVFNQTGDKKLATKAYSKKYNTLRRTKPEYKEKRRIRSAKPEYKEKLRLYKSKPEYKEQQRKYQKEKYYQKKHNIDLNNKLQTVVDNSRSIDTSNLDTSSISDYDDDDYYFEKFIDNNNISTS